MILTETNIAFPLSSVKPLGGMSTYRSFCLDAVRKALAKNSVKRTQSPVGKKPLVPAGQVDGLDYARCPETGSLFLASMPSGEDWAAVLEAVSQKRQSPEGFHAGVAGSRTENVYVPKLEWIQNILRIQQMSKPKLLEATILPSRFTAMLKSSGSFSEVATVSETALAAGRAKTNSIFQSAVLLESLDRSDDPKKLLQAVAKQVAKGGLVFATGLVASGFDMQVLKFENQYLYPPDRTNCFTLKGLELLFQECGFKLLEASTPGVLDVEIVQAHLKQNPGLSLSDFERCITTADEETRVGFQSFLQQRGLSSFARIVGRKE